MSIPEAVTSILIVYWFARLLIPVMEANDDECDPRTQ